MRRIMLGLSLAAVVGWTIGQRSAEGQTPTKEIAKESASGTGTGTGTPPNPGTGTGTGTGTGSGKINVGVVPAQPLPEFLKPSLEWLIKAQHQDGGWGAGSHANQQVKDPHQVPTDPATTAFVAGALLRAGHTPVTGTHQNAVRKATDYLIAVVEKAPANGPKITELQGTQIQAKLGPLVDTTMTAQYLARVLLTIPPTDPLYKKVDHALEICVRKLQTSQQKNGSWSGEGGWAPVLQSSLGCNALEFAQAAGKPIDLDCLNKARGYQKDNYDAKTGEVKAGDAAGVKLYAFSAAQRSNAAESRAADELVTKAKTEGKLAADAPVNEENLAAAGATPAEAKRLSASNSAFYSQNLGMNNEALLQGFGNNGGEEFFSYMLSSESLVIGGGKEWTDWRTKMIDRLHKVQNPDGSWSGHHCITSPAFCTAAVLQCITADRDAKILVQVADNVRKVQPQAPVPQKAVGNE